MHDQRTAMPTIDIRFDDRIVSPDEVRALAEGMRGVIVETTGFENVFLSADSPQIKINIEPIDVLVMISEHKIIDTQELAADIRRGLAQWKKTVGFSHNVNVMLLPMAWKMESDI